VKSTRTREITLVKEVGRQTHYRIVKLVNLLVVVNVGEVDVGMTLTRSDLQEAIQQDIKVLIYEARE